MFNHFKILSEIVDILHNLGYKVEDLSAQVFYKCLHCRRKRIERTTPNIMMSA